MEALFATLDEYVQAKDHEKVLEASEAILKEASGDVDAFGCKICALLFLERFREVVKAVDEWEAGAGKGKDGPCFRVEKAYALYKLRENEGALVCLEDASTPRTGRALVLRGQVLHRLERYGEAAECFAEARKADKELATDEALQANLVAAQVEAGDAAAAVRTVAQWAAPRTGLAACTGNADCLFNASCAHAAAGDVAAARTAATEALALAEEGLDDDDDDNEEGTSAAERAAELAPLRVQAAYTAQCAGERAAALAALEALLPGLTRGSAAGAVAANNVAALRPAHDAWGESLRRVRAAAADAAPRLSRRQQATLAANQCLLLLRLGRYPAADEALARLTELCGGASGSSSAADDERVAVLGALCAFYGGRADEALAQLARFREAHAGAVHATLVHAQLLVARGDAAGAAALLAHADLGAVGACAGVLACRALLHERAGDAATAAALLRRCAEQGRADPAVPRAVARHLAECGRADDASAVYALCPDDRRGVRVDPVRVQAVGQVSLADAEALCKGLPPVEPLAGVSPAALEDLPAPRTQAAKPVEATAAPAAAAAAAAATTTAEGASEAGKKKRRPKKKRLPKNMNPERKPDPERWLPKKQRKSYLNRKGQSAAQKRRAAKGTDLAVGLPGMQNQELESQLGKAMTAKEIQAQEQAAAIAQLAARSSGRHARGRRRH